MFGRKKKKPSEDVNSTEEEHEETESEINHRQLLEQDVIGWQVAHKRQVFLMKMLAGTVFVLGTIVVLQVSFIGAILPLKERVPVLVKLDEETQRTVSLTPLNIGVDGYDQILKMYVRQYVIDVFSHNPISYQNVKDATVFTDSRFIDVINERWFGSDEYRRLKKERILRVVEVSGIDLTETIKNEHRFQVEYSFMDKDRNRVVREGKRRVFMRVQMRPNSVPFEHQFNNAPGMYVVEMTEQEVR